MEKSLAADEAPLTTAATIWRVPESFRRRTLAFFQNDMPPFSSASGCLRTEFISRLIRGVLEIDRVERGRVICFASVKPAVTNYFGGLHGAAVAAIAVVVSTACARTVVPEEKNLFLGELNMSYLSSAPKNTEVTVDASVVRSGRNLTVIAVEFKMRETGKLVYIARATLYTTPMAKV